MSRPRRSKLSPGGWARNSETSGAVMVLVVIAMPVLLLFLLGTVELAMRAYYKAQVHSAATAAALAAVGTQKHWPVPIPTNWFVVAGVVPVPYDGYIINTLNLPNVDHMGGVINGAARQVADLTQGAEGISLKADVDPWTLPSPYKWVKITASVTPPGVFGKIFGQATITDTACAIAWIRPDLWIFRGWWTENSRITFGLTEMPFRYYRLVPCGLGLSAIEAVAEAHLAATGEKRQSDMESAQSDIEKYIGTLSGYQPDKERDPQPEEIEHCPDGSCRKPDPVTITCPDGSTHKLEPEASTEPKTISEEELKQQLCGETKEEGS